MLTATHDVCSRLMRMHLQADTVMDFLFASQDASTASLVWLTCLLSERPGVLIKVCVHTPASRYL